MDKKRAKIVVFLGLWLWLSYKLAGGFDTDKAVFSLVVVGALLMGVYLTGALFAGVATHHRCDD